MILYKPFRLVVPNQIIQFFFSNVKLLFKPFVKADLKVAKDQK